MTHPETERDPSADLAVCAAASPAPWPFTARQRDATWPGLYSVEETYPFSVGFDGEEGIYADNPADPAFIALARAALPHWIREAQAQRERAERAEGLLRSIVAARDSRQFTDIDILADNSPLMGEIRTLLAEGKTG